MKKVFIVLDSFAVGAMFVNNGWTVIQDINKADLVCFTGGADVSPHFYGERNVSSYTQYHRDEYEFKILEEAKELGIPCVGICRGGQLLNVAAGGKLWQDVNNHNVTRTHGVLIGDVVYQCSSTHHQMMRPDPDSEVIGIAYPALSSYKVSDAGTFTAVEEMGDDVEIIYHPKIQAMSFQPHPEFFQPDHECQVLFFNLINKYLL